MSGRLIVESGLATPPLLDLDPTTHTVLGRKSSSGVFLQDRHASRRHAEIYCRDGQWFLVDLDTTNGTRVDGRSIRGETRLVHNQVVGIGDVRLRFVVPGTPAAAEEPDEGMPSSQVDTSLFERDEMSLLVSFMNGVLGESSAQRVVLAALELVRLQTGAEMVGFLFLDDAPQLRLVVPPQATVDVPLSERLTRQVLEEGGRVWLGSPQGRALESESLSLLQDALCIPLLTSHPKKGNETPLGALHVYCRSRLLTERQVRFAEVVAGTLASSLRLLREQNALKADISRLKTHSPAGQDSLIGSSPRMRSLRDQIDRLANGPRTILIQGESGVGKELVALALHRQSSRGRGPLVTVNCAAIVGTMAESELFGHVRHAFTGANHEHAGFFAQADMGTLFLDELGELSLDLQAKLLRAIETRFFRPVGSRVEVQADVRILAATNRNLERDALEGRFRRDLFFRLTSRIHVPPLRDHLEDLPELVEYFLDHLAQEYRRRVTLSEAALERLMSYSWPGNVRQLRSVLEAAVAMASEGATLLLRDLNLPTEQHLEGDDPAHSLNLERMEEWTIRQALARTGHNHTQAARLLGIHRDTLINKLKRYGIGKDME
ncbi:MAG: sigma 54-interacting transcriptional regulator [Gemmataceae bacterium]